LLYGALLPGFFSWPFGALSGISPAMPPTSPDAAASTRAQAGHSILALPFNINGNSSLSQLFRFINPYVLEEQTPPYEPY